MATTTATGGYDAVRLSSSPELSSPPGSLSDPDSPSAQQLLNESLPAQNSEKRAACEYLTVISVHFHLLHQFAFK